ncbi:MAG: hypothetical protein ACJ8HI_17960 [Massilia sp.]
MKTAPFLAGAALLACFAAPAFAQEMFGLLEPLDPPEKRTVWVDTGFATYHFNRNKNLNGANHGLGVEYQVRGDLALSVGRFYNSDREWSNYAGVLWQPLTYKRWRFGVVAAGFDGYPRMHSGGWFPAIIPAATYDFERIGVNIGFVPSYKDRLYGGISLQLKFKVWN